MAGTYRHGRTYCQVRGCRCRVEQATEIDLPMAWEAAAEYTVLTVVVGLCRRHGHDVARRVRALLEARSELPQLLEIIDGAVRTEAELQSQLCAAESWRDHERERAEQAESALETVQVIAGEPIVLGVGDFELWAVQALVKALGRPRPPAGGAAA